MELKRTGVARREQVSRLEKRKKKKRKKAPFSSLQLNRAATARHPHLEIILDRTRRLAKVNFRSAESLPDSSSSSSSSYSSSSSSSLLQGKMPRCRCSKRSDSPF